jgi:poly(hydroxyalkanoate) depolymerase family esterase
MYVSKIIGILLLAGLFSCEGYTSQAGMVEVTGFGANPGALQMLKYVPESLQENGPLLVVLHGCGQTAEEIALQSGWSKLASEHGFIVIYPQQRSFNNLNRCFNWFSPEDTRKGSGEALSIKEMVDHTLQNHDIDENRIFVTGLSAGGAMTAVMIATYPELFDGGAVMAGVPYGAADNLASGFQAMGGLIDLSPEEWAEKVIAQNPEYSATYPRVAVFHGVDDPSVKYVNAGELVEQWTWLHGIDPAAAAVVDTFEGNPNVASATFADSTGAAMIIRYDITGLGHAIAVDPGDGPAQGGETGTYAKDVDFFSSYWTAKFFGIVE